MFGGDPENLSQSGSVQRASNEESEETEPSEELPKQSSSGQRFWFWSKPNGNEESEKTEPTGELSKQSSSGEMTIDEQSNEKVSNF